MADKLSTLEPVLRGHVLGITDVKQCEWHYLPQPKLPCVELTWGSGPYEADCNNALDVMLQFNARIKGNDIAKAREIWEALHKLWFDPTRFQAALTAGAANIQPFNLDPPVQFSRSQTLFILDIQFDIELNYSYP